MPTLVLLRHGQSTWNLEKRFTGWVDVDLTPRGTEVRRRLGAVGDRHMADVLSTWSTEDRGQLSTLLRRFVDGLRETPFRRDAEDLAS